MKINHCDFKEKKNDKLDLFYTSIVSPRQQQVQINSKQTFFFLLTKTLVTSYVSAIKFQMRSQHSRAQKVQDT